MWLLRWPHWFQERLGRGEEWRARRYVGHGGIVAVVMTTPLALVIWYFIPELLELAGAEGRANELATIYLQIILPSMPVLALAMAGGGVLRANGAARLAMYSTIAGGIANAVLDPFFIFTMDMGVAGAAVASVIARFTVLLVALRGIQRIHPIFCEFRVDRLWRDAKRILGTAMPAIATNLATPVGNIVVMRKLADFGDEAVAGYAIIGRLIPVAFGIVFALSGAIGPIVGQNYGAGHMDRVKRALLEAAAFGSLVVIATTLVLLATQALIVEAFDASPAVADLISFFVTYVAVLFIFVGTLFIANAAFNNLGKPLFSTMFNWGRATLGTLPFVYIGAALGGAQGVLLGHAVGGVVFGIAAFGFALHLARDPSHKPARQQVWRKMFATQLSAQTNIFGWIPSAAAQQTPSDDEPKPKE